MGNAFFFFFPSFCQRCDAQWRINVPDVTAIYSLQRGWMNDRRRLDVSASLLKHISSFLYCCVPTKTQPGFKWKEGGHFFLTAQVSSTTWCQSSLWFFPSPLYFNGPSRTLNGASTTFQHNFLRQNTTQVPIRDTQGLMQVHKACS